MLLKLTDRPWNVVAGNAARFCCCPKFNPKMLAIEPAATGAPGAKLPAFTTALIVGSPWPASGRVTPLLDFPPIWSDSAWFPADRLAGTAKNTRYLPTDDGSRFACCTTAFCPSTATVGAESVTANGADGAGEPVVIAGFVAPNPTASSESASPGRAGLAMLTALPSICQIEPRLPVVVKIPGAKSCICTWNAGEVNP